jgi:hypothetical protein
VGKIPEELDLNKVAAEVLYQQLKVFLNFGKGIFKTTKSILHLKVKRRQPLTRDNYILIGSRLSILSRVKRCPLIPYPSVRPCPAVPAIQMPLCLFCLLIRLI